MVILNTFSIVTAQMMNCRACGSNHIVKKGFITMANNTSSDDIVENPNNKVILQPTKNLIDKLLQDANFPGWYRASLVVCARDRS